MRNANQQAKLYRRKYKEVDRQKKLHAPIVPDLNHERLDRVMRCLDGEFNYVLVARSKVARGIQLYHWRRGWDSFLNVKNL